MFSDLYQLDMLDLHGNNLTSLAPGTLASLGALQQMSLRSNPFSNFPVGTFANQTQLQQLYLYDTKLTTIPSELFGNMSSLYMLDLSLNNLLVLEENAFLGLPDVVPAYNKTSGNYTGVWLVSNANMTIHSQAFAAVSTFFCGEHYVLNQLFSPPSSLTSTRCARRLLVPNSVALAACVSWKAF
eukprot:m.124483 g.124483  ORF g.124483 m.124483 type:complete len:184 (+) comp52182_c0_seq5:613-1164(+)